MGLVKTDSITLGAAVLLMASAVFALACVTTNTDVCASADSKAGQTTATITCRQGDLNLTLPKAVYYFSTDCTVPGTCVTTGAGYWTSTTDSNATCSASVDEWAYQSDCSAIITPGAATATYGPCTSETPTGAADCPAAEPPYDVDCLAML